MASMTSRISLGVLAVAVGSAFFADPAEIKSMIMDLVQHLDSYGDLAPFLFVVIHALFIIMCFPGTIAFEISAGFLFGWSKGVIIVFFAKNIGGCISFMLGSSLFRGWVQSKINSLPVDSKVRRIFQKIRGDKNAWRLALLLRFSPIPSWLNNYGLAVTPLPLKDFVFANAIGGLLFIVQNVYWGSLASDLTSLMSGSQNSQDAEFWKQPKTYFIALAFLATVLLTRQISAYLQDETENVTSNNAKICAPSSPTPSATSTHDSQSDEKMQKNK